MKRPMTSVEFEQEFGALADLPRTALVKRWRTHHRTDPPKGISRALLIRAIAYEMQAKRYGGLKSATDGRLRKFANGTANSDRSVGRTAPTLQSGARLVREWNGVNHVVEVVEREYVWNGNRYRSLSAIAHAITGARWSGPRFFGLTSDDAS